MDEATNGTPVTPEIPPESNVIPFPTSMGIETSPDVVAQPAPAIEASRAEPFNLDTIPSGTPIVFSKHEIVKAILGVQESRELIGSAIVGLGETQKWTDSPAYKALHDRVKSMLGVLESAYAYSSQSHETIYLVLSTANVANGITSRVEVKEAVSTNA